MPLRMSAPHVIQIKFGLLSWVLLQTGNCVYITPGFCGTQVQCTVTYKLLTLHKSVQLLLLVQHYYFCSQSSFSFCILAFG
jgi:hypothetical protein